MPKSYSVNTPFTKCERCNGHGYYISMADAKRGKIQAIKAMRADGLSIRQIMKRMGYKSPQSVQKLIKEIVCGLG